MFNVIYLWNGIFNAWGRRRSENRGSSRTVVQTIQETRLFVS